MRVRNVLLFGTVVASAFVIAAGPYFVEAQAQSAAGLTGQVSSAEEGPMEGVVVSARKDDSTITVSVVTDRQGHFSFPASRLEPGRYTLKARAVGYDLDGSNAIDVATGKVARADLKLKKTRNLSAQLTNAEWLLSLPGTDEQKKFLLNCNGCHTLERIVKSTHDAEEFLQVFERMGTYYPGSTPTKPQRLTGDARREGVTRGGNAEKIAEWLSTVNLSQQESRHYPLKTLPRLTGKSTQVIITEYDLPRPETQPHDVIVDEGVVWYSDFGQMFLGSMDPKTGKVTEYPIPETKKGFPVGLARSRGRQAGKYLGRRDVPGQHREVRQEGRHLPVVVGSEGVGHGCRTAWPSRGGQLGRGRQGLDQEFRRHQDLPVGSRDRQDGEPRRSDGPGHG